MLPPAPQAPSALSIHHLRFTIYGFFRQAIVIRPPRGLANILAGFFLLAHNHGS
jgi:hypothetical protein